MKTFTQDQVETILREQLDEVFGTWHMCRLKRAISARVPKGRLCDVCCDEIEARIKQAVRSA